MSNTVRRLPRLHFWLNSLMLIVFIVAIALAALAGWWMRPFALIGTYPNGAIAWEQWERRTLQLKYEHLETVRYYPTGQKSLQHANGKTRYWSPEGTEISASDWWNIFKRLPQSDAQPRNERPSKQFIWWWNGW